MSTTQSIKCNDKALPLRWCEELLHADGLVSGNMCIWDCLKLAASRYRSRVSSELRFSVRDCSPLTADQERKREKDDLLKCFWPSQGEFLCE